jgi:hypothetical protein
MSESPAPQVPQIVGDRTADGRLAVTVEEFGHLCGGLSRTSSYAAVRQGLVKSTRIGGRVFVTVREINRLLDQA